MLFMHKNYQTDGFKLKRGEKKSFPTLAHHLAMK